MVVTLRIEIIPTLKLGCTPSAVLVYRLSDSQIRGKPYPPPPTTSVAIRIEYHGHTYISYTGLMYGRVDGYQSGNEKATMDKHRYFLPRTGDVHSILLYDLRDNWANRIISVSHRTKPGSYRVTVIKHPEDTV
jgi:hypothetical protein